MKRALVFALATMFLSLAGLTVSAQRNFDFGSPVTENFDGLGTGTINHTNNVTTLGVYAARTTGNASPNPLPANNGGTNTGRLYNMGTAAASDRAFGTVSTTSSGTNYMGMRLVNSGSSTIGSITVQYTGEQWRHGNGANEWVTFEYQTGATVTSLTSGTWNSVPALTFTSPTNPPGQGALNGNAAANRTVLSATFAVTILPGTEIMLRWTDIVDSAQPDGFGIDDVSVSAVAPSAASAAISGRVLDSYGRAISSAMITVQGFSGESRRYLTNTFGYYNAPMLTVGESYVVSVSARRYTFKSPSYVVNLGDNVAGLNFVANR